MRIIFEIDKKNLTGKRIERADKRDRKEQRRAKADRQRFFTA